MNFSTNNYITSNDNIIINSASNISSIEEGSISLFKYTDTFNPIEFTYEYTSKVITLTAALEENQVYYVVLQNITLSNETLITKEIIKVYVETSSAIRNTNDLYYQLQTLSKFNSIKDILLNSDNKNFKFNPVSYNTDSGKYNYIKSSGVKAEVEESITDTARDLFINQYASEYRNYFNDIINRDKINTGYTLTEDSIKQLNLLVLENISRLNCLKGTKKLMEYVLGIYARVFNYQLISVVEDRNFNFLYRISTSIPKDFWIKNIKPIVHPCGWFDVYNYIDSILADQIVDYSKNRTDLKKYIRENFAIDTVSNLEADYIQRNSLLKEFIHLYGNINPEYVVAHETESHNACHFAGVYGEAKFNINWGIERNPWQYYLDGIDKEVYDYKNYKFFNDRTTNSYDIKYKTPGIGIEYIWRTFQRNKLIKVDRTPFANYSIDFDQFGSDEDYRVELSLKRYNWEKTVYRYDSTNLYTYKAITQNWTNHASKTKYLDIVAGNLMGENYDSCSLESLGSDYNNNTISIKNIQSYTFFDNYIKELAFKTEFDPDPQIYKIETEEIDSLIRIKISYKKVGVALKYIWNIIKEEVVQRIETTYLNFVEFYIPKEEIGLYKITLSIENKEIKYDLTNFVIFALRELNKTKPYICRLTYKPNYMMYPLIANIDSLTIGSFATEFINNEVKTQYILDYSFAVSGTTKPEFITEVDQLSNISVSTVDKSTYNEHTIKFIKPGIALLYQWNILKDSIPINSYETFFNELKISLPKESYEVELVLKNQDFSYTLTNKLSL